MRHFTSVLNVCYAIAASLLILINTAPGAVIDVYLVRSDEGRIEIHSENGGEFLAYRDTDELKRTKFFELRYPAQSGPVENEDRKYFAVLTGTRSMGTWPVLFRWNGTNYEEIRPGQDLSAFQFLDGASQEGLVDAETRKNINHLYTSLVAWEGAELILRIRGDGDLDDFGVALDVESGKARYLKGSSLMKDSIAGLRVVSGFARYSGAGTGFFVSQKGHIATCWHVVQGAARVRVDFGGLTYDATLVGYDESSDLAILKIGTVDATPFLDLENSRKVSLGAACFTIGFPNTSIQGFSAKFTEGSISAKSGIDDDLRAFQISVPVQPGNSGGPLIATGGHVIGIIQSTVSTLGVVRETGGLPQNVNYAVKSNLLSDLLQKSKVEKRETLEKALGREEAVALVENATVRLVVYSEPQ